MNGVSDALMDFIVAAVVPRDRDHASGTIERAEAILLAHPAVARANIHAAAILGDGAAVSAIAEREPHLVSEVRALGGDLLAKFAGTDNPPGVGQLLDLGVPVDAPFEEGDGYHGEPLGSLAIHVAAWRGRPAVVKLLIERGSFVDALDARGRTPLDLAVRACVDSYWTERRSPESVRALLDAGGEGDDGRSVSERHWYSG